VVRRALAKAFKQLCVTEAALHLRSVCWITTAFRGLRCHPLTCMLLKIRLTENSNPIAPTILPYTILTQEVLRLGLLPRSGFRLRALAPAKRLKFESYSAHHRIRCRYVEPRPIKRGLLLHPKQRKGLLVDHCRRQAQTRA